MRSAYRGLAYAIAVLVAVQAGSIAYAIFGLSGHLEAGNTVSREGGGFPGVGGFMVHGMSGMMVIPVVTLVFVIVAALAKIPGGMQWALTALGLVALQVLLGQFAGGSPIAGALHGVAALALFAVAVMAGMRLRRAVGDQRTMVGERAPSLG